MKDDERYMRLALEQAQISFQKGEVPVGALLVDSDGYIISRARNMPIQLNDPTAHAEILTIREAALTVGNYRLTGSSLYVTIEPCPMCAGAIVQARINRLVFGAPDPKGGACGSLYNIVQDPRLNHWVEVTQGVLLEDCRRIIQDFFRSKRAQGEVPKRS